MYRQDYQFGSIHFVITSDVPIRTDKMLRQFHASETEDGYWIHCCMKEHLPEPPSHLLLDTAEEKAWREAGLPHGYHTYQLKHDDPAKAACCWVRDGKKVEMLWASEFSEMLYAKNIFMSVDFFRMILEEGGALLHASYIVSNGKAILFSGSSGAGKSTQAALWERYRGAEIVNGDRALICPGSGRGFWAHGVCYCGTSGICQNISAPLAALVLPVKAEKNRIEKMRGVEAFRALLPRISYDTWDCKEVENAAAFLSAFLTEVPVFQLDCRPDESAVETLERLL